MSRNPRDMTELYATALEKAEAESILLEPDQRRLESSLRAVLEELAKYRSQMQQVAEVRREETHRDLKRTSRFQGTDSLRQAWGQAARREAASSDPKARIFYGLDRAEIVGGALVAKEASRLKQPGR